MPLPKRQKLSIKEQTSKPSAKTNDARFANFETDAKYRLPSKKHHKTKLDDRFSRILTDPDFYNKASIDKYGRKRDKDEGKKKLEKFYELEEEGEEDEDDDAHVERESARKRDRAVKKELAKVDIRGKDQDPIRDGGSSSSDESSSDEEDEDEDEEEIEDQAELAGQDNEVPTGEATSRLAAVNMDWDNIRAADIMAVANSFVPADGRILNVVVYPSDFGRERMQREEIEGPPRAIFTSSAANTKDNLTSLGESEPEDGEDEQTKQDLVQADTGDDFDSKALRSYQLDRLRYYYAIITCSSINAAKAVYDSMDGLEYLSSANFFDLRFVPDDTTFDEDPHEECKSLSEGYKPNEFTTDALTHSKVRLTWDAEDTTRQEVQKRAFSRKEVDENELQAYLGSDSEEEDAAEAPASKADALRAALGLSDGPVRPKPGSSKRDRDFKKPEGEMHVTFSAGLSANTAKGSVFENEPILDETTIEEYVRKQKERKQRRKDRAQAIKEGRDPEAETEPTANAKDIDEEDPWNDPFFGGDADDAKPSKFDKKAKKAKEREERDKLEKEKAAERADLELLMVDDEDAKLRHFDMNEIIKAEKAKKKGRKRKGITDTTADEDGFKMNTQDPRFAKLYESHEFAIDPTNPKYKDTSGMKALVEEGRKKRKHAVEDEDGVEAGRRSKKQTRDQNSGDADDLKKLAARVKAKSRKV
jgi:hypothetical protein